MRPILLHLGPFAMRFWDRFGFAHHRKAWCVRPWSACGPAGRFSTRFGPQGGCAKLLQKAGHDATHLPRGGRTLCAFPRTQHRQAELLAEQQLIAGTGHDPTPAFHLLRGTQMRLFPQQVLLEKAIAMLLGEALAIPTADLLQRHVLLARPDEPTFARIPFGIPGGFPLHADHTDFGLGCLTEMQVLPARDHHALAVLIDAFPLGISRSIRLLPCALKERAMFAGSATLLGLPWGRGSIPFAIAFEPNERLRPQVATSLHKAAHRVPPIGQYNDAPPGQAKHCSQLLNPPLDRGPLGANASLFQNADPTTGLFGQ